MRRLVAAVKQRAASRFRLGIRSPLCRPASVFTTPQYGPPQQAATGEQSERADPQQPRRALERRIVKHEIPVARDEVGANLAVALARKREIAHFAPQILRQRGV